jgi:hypothetical protein
MLSSNQSFLNHTNSTKKYTDVCQIFEDISIPFRGGNNGEKTDVTSNYNKKYEMSSFLGGVMFKQAVLVTALILLAVVGISRAGEGKKAKGTSADSEGTLVCTGCDLKTSEGAHSECTVYGHRYGLKTTDGRYISFLPNRYAEDLIKGDKYHDKKILVHGTYYDNANLIDVESFEVDGMVKTWCDHCKAMDSCAMKKGM